MKVGREWVGEESLLPTPLEEFSFSPQPSSPLRIQDGSHMLQRSTERSLSKNMCPKNEQTFGAFLLTLFPRCPVFVSRPSCLGRRVPVLL